MSRTSVQIFAALATASLVAGCGGGGSKSSTTARGYTNTTARGYTNSGNGSSNAEAAAMAGLSKYYADVASGNVKAACGDITVASQKANNPGSTCEKNMQGVVASGQNKGLAQTKVLSAKVTGNRAVVTSSLNGHIAHLPMALDGGTWKLNIGSGNGPAN